MATSRQTKATVFNCGFCILDHNIMTEQEIITKVKNYLIKTGRFFNQELRYNGIRK